MAEHHTIIESGGSAGIIAGIVLVALLVIAFFLWINDNGGTSRTVDIDVPAVTVDVQPDAQ